MIEDPRIRYEDERSHELIPDDVEIETPPFEWFVNYHVEHLTPIQFSTLVAISVNRGVAYEGTGLCRDTLGCLIDARLVERVRWDEHCIEVGEVTELGRAVVEKSSRERVRRAGFDPDKRLAALTPSEAKAFKAWIEGR